MKKILLSLLTALSVTSASAGQLCTLVIPFPAGGTSDIWARTLQKGNQNIRVETKPGAFSAVAINYLENHKDTFLMAPLNMYGSEAMGGGSKVNMIKVLFAVDLAIVTTKSITLDDLTISSVNIGVPGLGLPHHLITAQLKNKNTRIEIIPTNGDNKALPMIINKDLDAYVVSEFNAEKWVGDFPGVKIIARIPYGQVVTHNGAKLNHYNLQAIFMNKDATSEQRVNAQNCIDEALNKKEIQQELKNNGLRIINSNDTDSLVEKYLKVMRDAGI
jgi:tripartite-type tricarboxylate transporter receptor subunit TctC